MEQKIISIILGNPGARKRYIAHLLGVWQCDPTFLRTMNNLERKGLIFCSEHHDPAQMEFYDKWFVTLAAIDFMTTGE